MNKTLLWFILSVLIWRPCSGGSIEVNSVSRFKGNFGMAATIDRVATFLSNPSPDGETDVRARFYIRTTDLKLKDGQNFILYAGLNANGDVWFRVTLARSGGMTFLNLEARLDNGTYTGLELADQPPVARGWHAIEILWQAGAGTGQLQGFLNDAPLAAIANLANGSGVIDEVRLGAVSGLSSGVGGSMLIDDYDSRRDTHIGLLCLSEAEYKAFYPDFPQINMIRLLEYESHKCP